MIITEKYNRIMKYLLKPRELVFYPTEEDDKQAEIMADIVKYHLENNE